MILLSLLYIKDWKFGIKSLKKKSKMNIKEIKRDLQVLKFVNW